MQKKEKMATKKAKILYTLPNFYTAGSREVVLSIIKNLDKTQFKPMICVESHPEKIPSFLSKTDPVCFQFTGKMWKDLFAFRKFLKINAIDLVHSWDYKSNFVEALGARAAGIPYVYTKKNNSWNKRWLLKSFFAKHIAYDNPEMKSRFFKSSFFKNKITCIPHGIALDRFYPKSKTPTSEFRLVCIGNINSNKNQLHILRALKNLPERVVLHLYGKEEKAYKKKLIQYIEKNKLSDRVFFHGYIPNSEIPEVLNRSDVFVLASENEGFPVSILEALACEVLVLSSDSGGGSRFILDEKHIFSLEDVEDLQNKIMDLIKMDFQNRQYISNHYRKKIEAHFTVEKEVAAYENLYRKLLKIKKNV